MSRPDALPTSYSHNTHTNQSAISAGDARESRNSALVHSSVALSALYNLANSDAPGTDGWVRLSTGLSPVWRGCVDGRCRPRLRNGTRRHVLPVPTYDLSQEEAEKKKGKRKGKERGLRVQRRGMSRVGHLSVSTHVSPPASCGSGTVHLSACVSARLAVWHPLLPTLPDSEREQSQHFPHGDEAQPLIYPPTHSHWRVLQGTKESPLRPPTSACVFFHGLSEHVFTIHTVHNEESLQKKKKTNKKANACSNHDTPKHRDWRLTTVLVQ